MTLIGLTRVRNESLIIGDTLKHLDRICDGIVVYDDCSTDGTLEIVRGSPARVVKLIRGASWSYDRQSEETRHRRILMRAGIAHGADWLLYVDADERIEVDVRAIVQDAATDIDGFRLGLLDAYLTDEFGQPYVGGTLADLPRLYGHEERRILMLWRADKAFDFAGSDQREPVPGIGCRIADLPAAVKHFGKAISIAQWEDTCAYYAEHFPEPYREKWSARMGKALHTESDFGGLLSPWGQAAARSVALPLPRWNIRMLLRRLQVSAHHRTAKLGSCQADGPGERIDVADAG